MPAIKQGLLIYIIGPGETNYDDIVTGINDITWFEDKGSGVYEVKANHGIYVRTDGILVTGDENDFSKYERLDFAGSSNNSLTLNVQGFGVVKMFGDTHMDFSAKSPYYYASISIASSSLIVKGNVTYRSSWEGIFTGLISCDTTSFSQNQACTIDVEYMDFINRAVSKGGGSGIRFQVVQNNGWSFLNCRFDGNPEYTPGQGRGRLPYFLSIGSATDWRVLLESCIGEHFDSCFSFGFAPRWKNCVFRNNDSNANTVETKIDFNLWRKPGVWENLQTYTEWGQAFLLIEGNTWQNNSSITRDLVTTFGNNICLKDCDFQDPIKANITVQSAGTILVWTGNTFAGIWVGSATNFIARVFALQILITDVNDMPISNANVVITQKDNKERWLFTTDINGKINSHPLLDSQCLCIHKIWVSGNPVIGVFEYWSDIINDTYHNVEVSAFGYITKQQQIIMDQDRVLTIKLVVGVSPPPVLAKVLEVDSRYM